MKIHPDFVIIVFGRTLKIRENGFYMPFRSYPVPELITV